MTAMSNKLLAFIFAVLLVPAFAARIPEDKKDASHVVVGTVSDVFKSVGEKYTGYVVLLKLESIEKGEGLKAGELLYTYCYQRNPIKGDGPVEPGSIGHSSVPKKGQQIKVYVNRDKGQWEGVYPNWYEPSAKTK